MEQMSRSRRNLNATVSALSFSADGQKLISGSNDGYLRLWSLETKGIAKEWAARKNSVCIISDNRGGIVKLTQEDKGSAFGQHGSPFIIWSIDNRVDASYFFPRSESRFHDCLVTASSVPMSPHSEV